MTMTTYRTEFPDFDPRDMPTIPAGWNDVSWHNDACPSFACGRHDSMLVVYVDYREPADRELQDGKRFNILHQIEAVDATGDCVLETDSWREVLDFVQNCDHDALIKAATDQAEMECGKHGHRDTGRGICAHCGKVL